MSPRRKQRNKRRRTTKQKGGSGGGGARKQKGRGSYRRKQRGHGKKQKNRRHIGKGKLKDFLNKLARKTKSGIQRISKSPLAQKTAQTAKNILLKTGENIVRGSNPKLALKSGVKQFGSQVGPELLNAIARSMK